MKHKSWIIAIATIAVAVIIVIVTTLSLTLGRSDKAADAQAQAQAQAAPTPSPTMGIECEDGETKVTLEAGDSLLSLATEHGMSLSDLLTINPRITNPDTVQIGQTICVSDTSSSAQSQVDCDEFATIESGDTFGSIATANGISTSELMELNPLISDPNLLQIGQKICVSGTNTSVSSSSSTSIVSTATSCDETIFVEEGDTFKSLATENGLTTDELLELNPSIDDPDLIQLGQRICVSANNSTVTSSNTTATTTGVQCDETTMVEEGDTVKTLAAEYNLTISEILALNPEIYDPTLIRLGDAICVSGTPDEASLVAPSLNAASVYYSCNQPGLFALTYDDGPARTNINELLAKLAEYNVLATFYVNANNAADLINNVDDQANLQALYDQGHEVGTHTYAHDDLKLLTDTEIVDDLNKNEDVIESIIGRRTALLRPPYLSVNQRVLNVVGELGYEVVSTNLDTRDFENDGLPNDLEMILNIVRTNIEASNPATDSFISLQHEKTGDVVEVTEQIILLALAKGYKFVTVEECIGLPAYQA